MPDSTPLVRAPAANRLTLPNGFAVRSIGAFALFVVGGVHLQQYSAAYFSVIPTIGTLFMVNFIAATAAGLLLLISPAPVLRRIRPMLDVVATVVGIGVAAGALTALLISEHMPLFGFMEQGYRPEIVISIVAEIVAVAALCLVLAGVRRERS
jgi:hypothetical protein